MFENVKNDVTLRITELRSLLIHITEQQRNVSTTVPVVPIHLNIIKGLFFVHAYAVYEFTVTSLAQNTLSYINTKLLPTSSYKPLILSIILDPHCNSLEAGNGKKQWDRRRRLFQELDVDNVLPIDNTVLPTGEGNLKYGQLKSLIETLCMTCNPILDNRFIGRLEELVEHRNAISHGRSSPIEIGKRYSIADLEIRLNDIIELCTYLINEFEEYLTNETFKKPV